MIGSLEFDEYYSPHAQCVLTLLASLSIVEKAVTRKNNEPHTPTLSYEKFLELAENWHSDNPADKPLRSGGKPRHLDHYFTKPATARLKADAKNALSQIDGFMQSIVNDHYFKKNSPLARAKADKDKFGLLSQLAEKLAEFGDSGHLQDVIHSARPDVARDNCVRNFLRQAFGELHDATKNHNEPICHPIFPSLNIFDPITFKTEFHGLSKTGATDPNSGLFAVLREARGYSAQSKDDESNLLVRDILWILPESHPKHPHRKNGFAGFYASARDGAAFTLEDVKAEGDTLFVQGRVQEPPQQRFQLSFAICEQAHVFQFRDGVLSGTTYAGDDSDPTQPFLGAWKVVLIRPNWTLPLAALLLQCNQDERQKAYRILEDADAVGVVYSSKLPKEQAEPRRQAFHWLIANDPTVIKAAAVRFRAFLESELVEALGGNGAKRLKASEFTEMLGKSLHKHFHMFEPAQIVTFRTVVQTKTERDIRANDKLCIETLLDLSHVVPYDEITRPNPPKS